MPAKKANVRKACVRPNNITRAKSIDRIGISEMVDGHFPSGDGCLGESLGELSGYCCFLAVVWATVYGTVDTH